MKDPWRAVALIVGAIIIGGLGYGIGLVQGGTGGTAGMPDAAYAGHGYGGHFGFGFGLFGLVFPILFFVLIFAAARGLFGGGNGWHDSRGRLDEWHRRAHEDRPPRDAT